MKLTPRQISAVVLLRSKKNVLLFGGSRGGKTFVTVDFLIHAAFKYGCRILIARRYATDVRASIWDITIPSVLEKRGYSRGDDYNTNNTFMQVQFPSGGVIVCVGLDDKDRVDKALGTEYAAIYINESTDVPFSTVTLLKTRLNQDVLGFENVFITDLNPGSDAHWTNKLWIQNIHPETKEPLAHPENYGWIQMSPYDNKENLAKGYIEENLESLVGNARLRFLEGNYQSTSGLRVFNPKSLYDWPEFEAWAATRQGILKFTAGLDLGYQDADAFAIFAYTEQEKDVWLIYEHKARRETLEELVAAIRHGLAWVRQNVRARDHYIRIYAETATLRYGHEGDEKKTASMLSEVYGLPIERAYKRDKKLGIELLQDVVNSGSLHIPKGGPFHEETEQTIWTREIDGTIVRKIDDEAFHPDMMDAVLYPFRELWSYAGEEHRQLPPGPPPPPEPTANQVHFDRFLSSVAGRDGSDVW